MITIRDYEGMIDLMDIIDSSDEKWMVAHMEVLDSLRATGVNDIVMCKVAVCDEQVVGYIYGFALPNKKLIPDFLYVNPRYRGNNIGRKLLADLEEKSGCKTAMIFHNKGLHNYYASQGYHYGKNLETATKDLASTEGDTI